MAEGAGHALACDLMGSSPSDNGLVLSLVFEQMADHRRRTVLDVGRARRRKESFSARDWIACAMTCKFWNSLAEEFLFKAVCESLSWRLPRRPRYEVTPALKLLGGPWTHLWVNNACRFCYELGEFSIRSSGLLRNCSQLHLICHACTKRKEVVSYLVDRGLRVDLESLHGRQLLETKKKKKLRRR